jgi:hypothetical protein
MESALRIGRSASRTLLEYVLVAAIFLGSLVMWIGLPLGWLWLVTRLVEGYPEAYAGALFGCPVTMTLLGLLLSRLNSFYLRLSGGHPEQHRTAWLKSLSGERRGRGRRPRTVLETSMTISVVLAMVAITIWFFFFAHSYMPGLPAP